MTHMIYRDTRKPLPMIAGGKGVYLFDRDGKRYLDGSGGAAVSCLGHGDEVVNAAIRAQLDEVEFAYSGFFTSHASEALADRLAALAPEPLNHVYFVSGGSEATEAALKLARQYFLEIGQPKRHHVIARRQSYHGNTLGALATSGNAARRAPYAPLLPRFHHISACYEYRDRRADESVWDYGQRVADELEAEIQRLGPESVMAFVAEPVVGATLGAVPAVTGYFTRIREICDKYGVLLILDEVMCGTGRTGSIFAFTQEHIIPDIVTMAKGLGGGYQPIGAVLCSREIFQALHDGSGVFKHGHTYQAHAVACAAANAVIGRLVDDGIAARVAPMGAKLETALRDAFGQHPHVGDIRGRGLFWGLELVEDRETKRPFKAARQAHQIVQQAAFQAGLICYPMGGLIDGRAGDHVMLAPPYTITERQIAEIVKGLEIGLAAL